MNWFRRWMSKPPLEPVVELSLPSWRRPSYGTEIRQFRILAPSPIDATKVPGVPSLGDELVVVYRCESVSFDRNGPGVFTATAHYKRDYIRAAAMRSESSGKNEA